jgi:hypothetical protein
MHQVQQTESLVYHGQTLTTQNLQGFQCEALLLTTSFFLLITRKYVKYFVLEFIRRCTGKRVLNYIQSYINFA